MTDTGSDLDARRTEPMTAAALAGAARPRRWGWWYVAEHYLRSMRAYGMTIVVGGVGAPLVYLLGLGLGLAAVIDSSVAAGAAGPVSYVQFVAPALLATAAVSVATEEFSYTVMSGFTWSKVFWGMNNTPLVPHQIAAGLVVAVTFRMLFVTAVYYVLMLLFGAVVQPVAGAAMIALGVLAGLAFGLPLLAFSATITQDKGQFALVQRFVFTPLFLFSGTFYPLDTLPALLQPIGWISPLWHAAEIGRWLSYGAPTPGWLLAGHLGVLLVMALVGALAARRVFVRRLR